MIRAFSFTLFLFFSIQTVFAQSEEKQPVDTVKNQIVTVEINNLSKETNRLNEKIKRANSYLSSLSSLVEVDSKINELNEKIIVLDSLTTKRLEEDPSIRTLRELQESWKEIDKKAIKVEENIRNIFSGLETHKNLLKEELEKWKLTLESLSDSTNREVLEKPLKNNIAQIDTVDREISDSTTKTLELSNKMISFKNHMLEIQGRLSLFEEEQLTGLFSRNQPAIWNSNKSNNDTVGLANQMSASWNYIAADTALFISKNTDRAIFHLILFILFLTFFYYASANISSWETFQEESLKPTVQFISKPLWAAIFVSILISNNVYKGMPVSVKDLNNLLALIPLVFLLPQLLPKKFHVIIYLLAVTFFLDQVVSLIGNFEVTKRWIVLIEGIISLVGFTLLYRIVSSNLKSFYRQQPLFTSFFPLVFLAIILLLASVFGVIRGNTAFAFYVVRGVVFSSVSMFLFFVIISMSKGLLTLFYYGQFLQKSNIVSLYKKSLAKNSLLILKIYFTFVWSKIVLVQFGFFTSIEDYIKLIADLSWKFGSVTFTLGHLWDAIWVLIVAWFIGLVLKALLQDEILPRFNLKRGLPTAIGVSSRYFILTMGFFLAVASLGIDLNKLSFIAGALSVGIGFGLQNIVGNFISGLILLFERPIVAGDLIVMGSLDGVVLEIGLRASKVKTWDGAEVIVPNGDLITKQVTNLTLTDKNRRREIVLETERDAEPREIIKAIHETIILNQEVLSDPSPQVLFKGQHQNYYRFRVLYWVTGNILVVGSDISLRINETLKDMNVRIAIPESRVNLSDGQVKKATGK